MGYKCLTCETNTNVIPYSNNSPPMLIGQGGIASGNVTRTVQVMDQSWSFDHSPRASDLTRTGTAKVHSSLQPLCLRISHQSSLLVPRLPYAEQPWWDKNFKWHPGVSTTVLMDPRGHKYSQETLDGSSLEHSRPGVAPWIYDVIHWICEIISSVRAMIGD